MSVSHCLGPAVRELRAVPRDRWKHYIDALPSDCPHADCTAQRGCREHVAGYFRMQWRVRVAKAQRASHGQG